MTVSKFVVGQPDQKRTVSTKIDESIRAIVELGGTYPDVVQALQQAKSPPRTGQPVRGRRPAGRRSDVPARKKMLADTAAEPGRPKTIVVASPVPDLFSSKKRQSAALERLRRVCRPCQGKFAAEKRG